MPLFSFRTNWGLKIKTWCYHVSLFYILIWGILLFSIFLEYPQKCFLVFLDEYNLKNVLLWPDNFHKSFKIIFLYTWFHSLIFLGILIIVIFLISFFFTNQKISLFIFKYFWLFVFLLVLSFFFFCWYFFISETISLNFRNTDLDKPGWIKFWFNIAKFRIAGQLSYIFFYVSKILFFNLLILGVFYIIGRIYFTFLKKELFLNTFFIIMLSPLEQFEIISLMSIFYQKFIFSNSNLFFIVQLLLAFFVSKFYLTTFFLPNRYQYIIEQLYLFIFNLIEQNVNKSALKYFPFIFTLFLVILLSNFIGMVPYSFTITSHLIFTLFLSFLTFFGINFIGLQRHGLHFFSLFLPAGAPFILAPFLIFIELLSYIARVFSLAIRLFANLMSGHTLLKILSEFGWTMFISGGLGFLTFLFPFVIVLLITGLELAIAGLQAYVFTILTCIYFNDALNLH